MKKYKFIYYFLLCHLFPNRIIKGDMDDHFAMGFVKEGNRR